MTDASEEPDLRLEDVALGYGGAPVLEEVGFSLARGEAVGMVGPNGAGKTTLLRAMLGILTPLSGRISRRRGLRVAFVPQRERFDPVWPLTAEEVVLQGLLPGKGLWPRWSADERTRARRALQEVGMTAHAAAAFRDLSGGQQQRVVLARALAPEPEWLILDEPTAGLDMDGTSQTLELVARLRAEHAVGVLLVSHHLPDVLNHMERILLVGHGRVDSVGIDATDRDARLSDFYGVDLVCREVEGVRVAVPRPAEGAGG